MTEGPEVAMSKPSWRKALPVSVLSCFCTWMLWCTFFIVPQVCSYPSTGNTFARMWSLLHSMSNRCDAIINLNDDQCNDARFCRNTRLFSLWNCVFPLLFPV